MLNRENFFPQKITLFRVTATTTTSLATGPDRCWGRGPEKKSVLTTVPRVRLSRQVTNPTEVEMVHCDPPTHTQTLLPTNASVANVPLTSFSEIFVLSSPNHTGSRISQFNCFCRVCRSYLQKKNFLLATLASNQGKQKRKSSIFLPPANAISLGGGGTFSRRLSAFVLIKLSFRADFPILSALPS